MKALNKTIHRTIIDEGATTCIMSMSCWKALSSPALSRSSMTLKEFDGQTYTPYRILSNLQVELGGKAVEIDVEVINGNLNYNILLGRPWIYVMAAVVSTYFRKIAFPFQGGITTINQQTFLPKSSQVTGSIPMIHGSSHLLQNIGVGMLKDPTLMGTFALPPQSNLTEVATVETCNMISSISKRFRRFLNILSAWIIAILEIL